MNLLKVNVMTKEKIGRVNTIVGRVNVLTQVKNAGNCDIIVIHGVMKISQGGVVIMCLKIDMDKCAKKANGAMGEYYVVKIEKTKPTIKVVGINEQL